MCLRLLVVFWEGGGVLAGRHEKTTEKKPVGMFNKLKTYCRFNLSGHKGGEAEEEKPPGTDISLATGCSQSQGRTTAPGTNLLCSLSLPLLFL